MKISTIGLTEKKAEKFFSLIQLSNCRQLVDVRLNNISQLAGFAKKDDLKYFLSEICNVDYRHEPDLAPTKQMLKPYQQKEITWEKYSDQFIELMAKRKIEKILTPESVDGTCLLCSEHLPHQCHRRLVVEYLQMQWPNLKFEVKHLT